MLKTKEGPASAGGRPGLYRKLVWISFFRLLVVTVLFAATAILTLTERDALTTPVQVYLYGLTPAVYIASIVYLVAMRFGPAAWLPWIAHMQVAGDVLMAAFLVWLTGGGESVFSFVFSLGIIHGAILLYRPGAVFAALLSAAAFSLVTLGLQLGLLPPSADFMEPQALRPSRLAFTLFINGASFLVIAVLASYLSEAERKTGRRLYAAEEGLAALSALHERIVQSVASGILTLDPAGRISFINRPGQEVLGAVDDDWRGRSLEEVLPELAGAIGDPSAPSRAKRGEIQASLGGQQREIGFTATPLTPLGDAPGGVVVVFQDLTVLRQMEEQVRRNERLAAVGVLAAGLAHEIRNPLSSMSGSVELLKSELPEGAGNAALMDIVIRETERLDRLIDDFLGFAKPAPLRKEKVSFDRIAKEAVELFRLDPMAASCEVEISAPDNVLGFGDEGQLRRALLNLLLNAAQAMEGRGKIKVVVEKEGSRARLSVMDDGPGIAREDLERIFDPFYTTHDSGTGLGLALVHRTVEAHDGIIDVRSEKGAGSCFTIELPADNGMALMETG